MLFPQLYHFVSSISASFSRVSITCSVLQCCYTILATYAEKKMIVFSLIWSFIKT